MTGSATCSARAEQQRLARQLDHRLQASTARRAPGAAPGQRPAPGPPAHGDYAHHPATRRRRPAPGGVIGSTAASLNTSRDNHTPPTGSRNPLSTPSPAGSPQGGHHDITRHTRRLAAISWPSPQLRCWPSPQLRCWPSPQQPRPWPRPRASRTRAARRSPRPGPHRGRRRHARVADQPHCGRGGPSWPPSWPLPPTGSSPHGGTRPHQASEAPRGHTAGAARPRQGMRHLLSRIRGPLRALLHLPQLRNHIRSRSPRTARQGPACQPEQQQR